MKCVCEHTLTQHIEGKGRCLGICTELLNDKKLCYCPRFIPKPLPPGAHRGEGKDKYK
jgi:hypothetical protein